MLNYFFFLLANKHLSSYHVPVLHQTFYNESLKELTVYNWNKDSRIELCLKKFLDSLIKIKNKPAIHKRRSNGISCKSWLLADSKQAVWEDMEKILQRNSSGWHLTRHTTVGNLLKSLGLSFPSASKVGNTSPEDSFQV